MRFLPPRKFRSAEQVEWAEFADEPSFVNTGKKPRGRRAEGLRYEGKAQNYLSERLGQGYLRSPWLRFMERGADRPRWCQPDGLYIDFELGKLVIVEVKLQHTLDAWWQLEHLYIPVIRRAFAQGIWTIATCEVVKWYDPAVAYPVAPTLRENIVEAAPNDFSVHIWKPGR